MLVARKHILKLDKLSQENTKFDGVNAIIPVLGDTYTVYWFYREKQVSVKKKHLVQTLLILMQCPASHG